MKVTVWRYPTNLLNKP